MSMSHSVTCQAFEHILPLFCLSTKITPETLKKKKKKTALQLVGIPSAELNSTCVTFLTWQPEAQQGCRVCFLSLIPSRWHGAAVLRPSCPPMVLCGDQSEDQGGSSLQGHIARLVFQGRRHERSDSIYGWKRGGYVYGWNRNNKWMKHERCEPTALGEMKENHARFFSRHKCA